MLEQPLVLTFVPIADSKVVVLTDFWIFVSFSDYGIRYR